VIAIKWFILNISLLMAVQNFSQSVEKLKYMSFNFKEQPLSSVLEEIRVKAEVNFVYPDNLINEYKVTAKLDNGTVEGAISKVLSGLQISYKTFPPNSYVLFKYKKPVEKKFKAVVLKEEIYVNDTTDVLTEPKLISNLNLVYPLTAIEQHVEGNVKINLFVNKEGNVSKTQIEQTSGSATLDSAVIDYTRDLKFIPAQVEGKPINIWISMLFKYFFEKQ
jgi:TonB family protein